MARLKEGLTNPFVLISAPAGFGKTTLLVEWNTHNSQPLAWVSLDRDDNDVVRFWLYFITALQKLRPGLGGDVLSLLSTHLPQPVPYEFFLPALINEIAEFPEQFTIFLDDYHVITDPTIHDGLIYLLDHMPTNLHLVLLTRVDPPFPLGRLRARNQMTEVRAHDLSFNSEETTLFFNQAMGLNLTSDEICALDTRTEGWITGMQLAALSLQGSTDIGGFIAAFTGSHRYILDYLIEEVFQRQSEKIRSFLLETSFLDRLTAPLCDEITGEKDGEATLVHLEQANLFLVPLDSERKWYRYHPLFAELLQWQLNRTYPNLMPVLQTRVACWYERNGFPGKAIEHAFAALDFQLAADILERHSDERWSLSDVPFLGLIGKLPGEVLRTRPKLAVYRAWALVLFGQMKAAETLLLDLSHTVPAEDPEAHGLRSFINLLLAYIPLTLGRDTERELPDRKALEYVPDQYLGMRNSADVIVAYMLYFRGDFEGAIELLQEAVQRDLAAGGTTAIPIAISRLARMRMIQGRLGEAADVCREYLNIVREQGTWQYYITGTLNFSLSSVLAEWNELDAAEAHIRQGLHANQPWDTPQIRVIGITASARLQYHRGDIEGAAQTVDELERNIQGSYILPDQQSELEALKVRLWIAGGNLAAARQWVAGVHPTKKSVILQELEQLTCARVLMHTRKPKEALTVLDPLIPSAEAGRRLGRVLEIQLLRAIALGLLDREAEALQALEKSLSIGAEGGYLRTFLNEGQPIQTLLLAYLRSPSPAYAAYARRLLESFGPALAFLLERVDQPQLGDPLSPRELEVLRLVANGYSNQAIAQELFITVGTVKRHLSNIFIKMEVSSRTQAIAFARELHLL